MRLTEPVLDSVSVAEGLGGGDGVELAADAVADAVRENMFAGN